jgi:hypothetical protein
MNDPLRDWKTLFPRDRKKGKSQKLCLFEISIKDGNGKFKVNALQIDSETGEEANERELLSETDGTRQLMKYEKVAGYNYVRFHFTGKGKPYHARLISL